MQLPVDTNAISFLAASEAEPLTEHDSARQRTDRDGQPLFVVKLVALTGGEAEILTVRIAGQAPKGITQGMPVRVTGLSATPYSMTDQSGKARAGITYRATRVEPLAPARQTS